MASGCFLTEGCGCRGWKVRTSPKVERLGRMVSNRSRAIAERHQPFQHFTNHKSRILAKDLVPEQVAKIQQTYLKKIPTIYQILPKYIYIYIYIFVLYCIALCMGGIVTESQSQDEI